MFFAEFYKYLITFLVSMIPILEIRGAFPIGTQYFGLSYFETFIISSIGNIIPIYFIIKYIGPIFDFLRKFKFTKKIIDWLTEHTTKKIEKNPKLQTATELALFLFVAIPLPGTGAWTGALIANFLKLPVKKAFLPVALGVIGAGIITLIVTATISRRN